MGHSVPQQRMKDVELREWLDKAGERPIALDQCCVGEEGDGACQAKDDDVVAVVADDVVRLLDEQSVKSTASPVLFVAADDVCDGPFVHRGAALLLFEPRSR